MSGRTLQNSIRRIVAQIVALARPRKVILFGSATSGRVGADGDIDFLIVVPDGNRPEEVQDRLNMGIRRKPKPCDFLVTTSSVLRRHRRNPGLIYASILREGKEVYGG